MIERHTPQAMWALFRGCIYVKSPAPDREPRLAEMLARIRDEGGVSYQRFADPAELHGRPGTT